VILVLILLAVNNRMPNAGIPPVVMPNPNARDLILAAAALAQNLPGPRGTLAPPASQRVALADGDAPARAALHNAFQYPYMEPRYPLAVPPPYGKFRSLSLSLNFDAQAYAAAHRWDESVEAAIDIVQMGEMMPRGNSLTGRLVGASITALGRMSLWNAVGHVSAGEARAASARLEAICAGVVPYADTLLAAKWAMLTDLQNIFRTREWTSDLSRMGGSGTASARAKGLYVQIYAMSVGKTRIMQRLTSYMDEQIAFARQPYTLNRTWPKPPADVVSQNICAVFPGAYAQALMDAVDNRHLMTLFALRAYKLDQGTYPDTLQDLVSHGYLKALPMDPFSPSHPISYRRSDAKFILYSVGPDGVDDGGKPIFDVSRIQQYGSKALAYMVNADSKGDIVAGVN
jgi:hypothetical protein